MTLGELATLLGGELRGPADLEITRPVEAGNPDPHGITFGEKEAFLAKIRGSGVGAALVPMDDSDLDVPTIRLAHPRAAFGRVLAMFDRPLPLGRGIHSSAVIEPGASVASDARIGPGVVIQAGATVGSGAVIHALSFIGEGCSVGADTVIYPRVVLVQDVRVGERCIIHSGAVLGADGFGFAWDGSAHRKVPQVGGVLIGDDVEIGANTTIDRATCGDTVIGSGTKIDNLVQIAHNAKVGHHTVIAACVAMAGSSSVGNGVVVAGQAAITDHASVADGSVLGGRTGVTKDITIAGEYWGTPAIPVKEELRRLASIRSIPELQKRIAALEKLLQNDRD